MKNYFKRVVLSMVTIFCLVFIISNMAVYAAGENVVKITTQPQNKTVAYGKEASVSLVASGDELKYQWYYTMNGSSNTFYKSSRTYSTYTTVMDADRDGRKIYCVVTDKYGNTAKSNTVTLGIIKEVKILSQPKDILVGMGEEAKVSVRATGDDLTYQWYYTANGKQTTFNKSSNTTNIYSTVMDETKDGRKVYCVITDRWGVSVKSEVVTLEGFKQIKILNEEKNLVVKSGETASVKIDVEGEGITYQWYYADRTDTSYKKSVSTGNTYSTVMDASKHGRKIYCILSDKHGNKVQYGTVKLELEKCDLQILEEPKNAEAAKGGTVSVSVKAQGEGLKYQWYYTENGVTEEFQKSTNVTSAYTTTMTPEKSGRQVYCEVTDCFGKMRRTETVRLYMKNGVRVSPLLTISDVICGEEATASVYATGEGLKYQWYYTKDGNSETFLKSANTSKIYKITAGIENRGRKVYCVVTDKYGCSEKTQVDDFYFYLEELAIKKQPVGMKVARGQTASATVTAEGLAIKYQWYYTQNASSSAFLKSSNTTASYSTVMDETKAGRKVYCVMTDAQGKTLKSDTVTLEMAAPIKIKKQPQNVMLNVSESAEISVEATGENLSYEWYRKIGDETGFTYTYNSKATCSVYVPKGEKICQYYCVISDNYGQSVKTNVVTVKSVVYAEIQNQPKSNSFKLGEVATAEVAAIGDGLKYQWYYTLNGTATAFNLSSCNTPVYSTTMTEDRAGRKVYCVITDEYGNKVKSNTVTLSKWSAMKITTQLKDVQMDRGEEMSLTVKISGGKAPYHYIWKDSDGDVLKHTESYNTSATFTKKVYSDNFVDYQVYCVVTDDYNAKLTTKKVSITPKSLKISTNPIDTTIAVGSKGQFQVAAEGGTGAYTYQWQIATDSIDDSLYWFDIDDWYENYSGYDTNTLKVKVSYVNEYMYLFRCVITDEAGNRVVSEPASLNSAKFLISRNLNAYSYLTSVGKEVSFEVAVAGGTPPYTFKWYMTDGKYVYLGFEPEIMVDGNKSKITFMVESSKYFDQKICCQITDATGKTLDSNMANMSQEEYE